MLFLRLFELFVDYLYKNVPYFRQEYLRLFEIMKYLHYLRLTWIIANYCGFFVLDYLRLFYFIANCLWIICFGLFVIFLKHGLFEIICPLNICGLFVPWNIWDYLSLDYLCIF